MTTTTLPERTLTDKAGAEFGEKLLRFRDSLPSYQRKTLNKLIGGAIATERFMKKSKINEEANSFSDALTTFRNGLPPEQREGLTAMLSAGALAWGLGTDPIPEDDEKPIFFFWVHIARTAAVIVTGAILIVEEATEDDEEIIVPVIDLPDIPH